MANPKRRHSKQRKRLRRVHKKPSARAASTCPQCSSTKLPHHVCKECGYYRGRPVLSVNA